jgi:integrase
MKSKVLTATRINAMKPATTLRDSAGLYIRKGAQSNTHWIFRYMLAGRARMAGLGAYPEITIAKARELATEWRGKLKLPTPIDPLDERQATLDAMRVAAQDTFGRAAESWLALNRDSWSRSYARDVEQQLRRYCGSIWNVPVTAIDDRVVFDLLEPLWARVRQSAAKVRQHLEGIIDYAVFRKMRTPGLNPARWGGHLEHGLASIKQSDTVHIASMTLDEIPTFAATLRNRQDLISRALEFLLLTCVRSHDVRIAKWSDIVGNEWRIPSLSKVNTAHTVPLCARSMEILSSLPRVGDYIFASPRDPSAPLGERALQVLIKTLAPNCAPHGLRSAFKGWATERTNYPNEMSEIAMGHKVGTKVEQAYRRTDMLEKRRHMMQAWASFVETPTQSADVVPLQRKRG